MLQSQRRTTDRLFHAYLLLLLWIPLPRASNRPEAWGLMEILVFLLLQAWLWRQIRQRKPLPAAIRTARPALALWALWLVWGAIQLLPLPPDLLALLSPKAAELSHLPPLPAESWAPLSLSPHNTQVQWLKGLSDCALFFLTLALVDSRRRMRRLAFVITASAAFQAVYGALMTLSGLELGFLVEKSAYLGSATGTFVNRNHFANYLALAAAVAVGAILAQLEDAAPPRSARMRWRNLLNWLMSGKMWLRLALLAIAVGIVTSHSRMGNAAFFLGLHVAGLLAWLNWPPRTRPAILVLLASMVVLDVFIIGSLVGLERVTQRIEHTSAATEGRDEIARDTLDYWRDFPLFGSGAGTYAITLPAYKKGDVKGFYDHAHNDYLEFGAESGVIGLGLLCLLALLSLRQGWRALRQRRDPWKRALGLASLTGILAMGLHASVDFSLQIPANAGLFSVLLALAWIGATSGSVPATTGPNRFPFAPGLLILLALQFLAFRLAASDFLSNESNARVQAWRANGEATMAEWKALYRSQQRAVTLSPGNGWALVNLARLEYWRHALPQDPGRATDRATLQALLKAVKEQPGNGKIWLAIATVRLHQGQADPLFRQAIRHTARLVPWETKPQWSLLRLLTAALPLLEPAERPLLCTVLNHNLQLQPDHTRKFLVENPEVGNLCLQGNQSRQPDMSD